jgi:photosystem II stability/assembly factor-like uncharacterized protein
MIWALESGDATQPGRLWAGTLPGGLFKSEDGGKSWELVRGLWDRPERASFMGGGADFPGLHSICRDPRDPKCLRIAISSGGVWVTHDDGATWELVGEGLRYDEGFPPEMRGKRDIQDVHQMKQCRSAPDHLWIQHHCGVFKSTDGGQNWTWSRTRSRPASGSGWWFTRTIRTWRGSFRRPRTSGGYRRMAKWW